MARKRMFDKELIDCDLFIDLPIPSQCLYFHLSMRADDEGFIGNVKGILRLVGFKDEDLRPLVERKFIIVFENGVIVIKHWKLNNYLRGDRCKETIYLKEKSLLNQDNNGVYNLGIPNDNQMETIGRHSIEENSIEENSIEENSICGENKIDYTEIIDYLNLKTNSSYKSTTPKTRELIKARYNEGFTLDDFKQVIDNKVSSWGSDEKMVTYLRPETLFSNKFEGYLNEKVAIRKLDPIDQVYMEMKGKNKL